ncbi:MAG: Uncharacterized protein CEN90_422 [Parcubacteria group bacterium Licking1014_17]|nr:MAG: Uncharacterized protein CEN90_422 [Parcubacteria group bacterium Licking1014_17]
MGSIMTSRQAAELDHAFERGGWTPEDVKKLSGGNIASQHLKALRGEAEIVLVGDVTTATNQDNGGITYATSGLDVKSFLKDWADFYKEALNIRIRKTSQIPLPPVTPGFNWGVLVVPGVTMQMVFDSFPEKWKFCDANLDEVVTKNVRMPVGKPYVIWTRDRVEADEELKNLSASWVAEKKINSINLLERLLLGRWFNWKTSGHLDNKNVTLCAGSRHKDGVVPVMYRGSDVRVYVSWDLTGLASGRLRARQVVSL